MMTNGLALYESYQFKRMIHGIHGNSKRTSPFTHGNKVQGVFSKAGALTAAGTFFADQKVTIGTTSTTVVTAGTAVALGSLVQEPGRVQIPAEHPPFGLLLLVANPMRFERQRNHFDQ